MGIFDTIGGALTGAAGGFLSGGGPIGAIAGGVGGLLGGGGAQGAGLGALGGLIGGQQGVDPALIAAISGISNAQLQEQQASRQASEQAFNQRNDLLSRNLQLAEQQFGEQAPLRQAGMGAVTQFLGGNTRGIFNNSASPGDLGLGAPQAGQLAPTGITGAVPPPNVPTGPPTAPIAPQGPQVLPPNTFQGDLPPNSPFGRSELTAAGGKKLAGENFNPEGNVLQDLLAGRKADIGGLRGKAGIAAQTAQLAPDARKDGDLNAAQLLARRAQASQIGQALGAQPQQNPVRAF